MRILVVSVVSIFITQLYSRCVKHQNVAFLLKIEQKRPFLAFYAYFEEELVDIN